MPSPPAAHRWRTPLSDTDPIYPPRRRAGVHERTFLQPTPMGDLVIVTLEGEDPARSFGQMMEAKDAFMIWFAERAQAVHGVDLTIPMTAAPSELVIDTDRVHVPA